MHFIVKCNFPNTLENWVKVDCGEMVTHWKYNSFNCSTIVNCLHGDISEIPNTDEPHTDDNIPKSVYNKMTSNRIAYNSMDTWITTIDDKKCGTKIFWQLFSCFSGCCPVFRALSSSDWIEAIQHVGWQVSSSPHYTCTAWVEKAFGSIESLFIYSSYIGRT